MTNKEAIDILRNAAFLATSTSYQAIEEAVEMAVKALENEDAMQWIPSTVNDICSRCGGRGTSAFDFCPHCGRKAVK